MGQPTMTMTELPASQSVTIMFMARFRQTAIVIALVLVVSSITALGQNPKLSSSFRVGLIKDSRLFHEGGCSMQLPNDWNRHNDNYIFISDFDNRGFINIDGKDFTLRQESADEGQGRLHIGKREKYVFRGEGVEVVADYVVTWICPPANESCEVTHYDGKLTVTRGSEKQTIVVKGLCGS